MKFKSNLFQWAIAYCIFFGHLTAVPTTAWGQSSTPTQAVVQPPAQIDLQQPLAESAIVIDRAEELKDILDLVSRVNKNKKLYTFLNEIFASQLEVSPELQKKYGLPAKIKGLSESQLVYLFFNIQEARKFFEVYSSQIQSLPEGSENSTERKEIVKVLKAQVKQLIKSADLESRLKGMNDPARPLRVIMRGDRSTYSNVQFFVNHAYYEDPENENSKIIPGHDLQQKVIELINTAKESISVNVFEFNLPEVAEALIKASERGVTVRVGVDAKTAELTPENTLVTKKLEAYMEKVGAEKFSFVRVNSVALNHQKLIVVDAKTNQARVMALSGNLTQSCIGAEGDILKVPLGMQRPEKSIPNANHAVIFNSQVAALYIEHELDKTLRDRLRGSDYPISGSITLTGPRVEGKRSSLTLTFSPNGGMGDLNKTIIAPLILASLGKVEMMHFAASSEDVKKAFVTLAKNLNDKNKFDIKFVGDPPFSLRDWSLPVFLSGLKVNESGEYISNEEFLRETGLNEEQLEVLRRKIRIDTNKFGEFPGLAGVKISVKLHHKVFIFPLIDLAIMATSFNPSASAETNQEQLFIFNDRRLVRQIRGALLYLYKTANMTVSERAEFRNRFKIRDAEKINPEDAEIADKKIRRTKANQCLRLYN